MFNALFIIFKERFCSFPYRFMAFLKSVFIKERIWVYWGFTLLELIVVIAIVGTLSSIGVSNYLDYIEKAKVTSAIADIHSIGKEAMSYAALNKNFPDTLSVIGFGNAVDPWGNPYQYLKIASDEGDDEKGGKGKGDSEKGVSGKGKMRKDRFLVPINSDFDLYSMGKDGSSVGPLTAKASHDDIIRANNGGYVGIATGY